MLNFFLKITINTSICTLGKSTNDINVVIKYQYKPLSIFGIDWPSNLQTSSHISMYLMTSKPQSWLDIVNQHQSTQIQLLHLCKKNINQLI